MRAFRLTLYFVIGLLLGGLFSLAHAETIPAMDGVTTPLVKYWYNGISFSRLPSQEALCANSNYVVGVVGTAEPTGYHIVTTTGTCVSNPPGGSFPARNYLDCPVDYSYISGVCTKSGYSCPTGQNWTLTGDTCTRPDCVSPQTRQDDGTCAAPCESSQTRATGSNECVCDPAHLASFPTAYGSAMEGTGSSPDSACVGGCMRKTGSFCLGGGGTWWCDGGAWTSQKCSGGATNTEKPPDKKPPCGAGEGVMTSSSGKVGCVPEGTPNARPPKAGQTVSKETAADGTVTETTKNTVCDSATGACNTTTTTKTTSPTGEVQNSEKTADSGGSGTTAPGSGDNSGDEPGECAKEPDSPMCKKGTVKEKGEFSDSQNGELDAAKSELRSKFAEIKAAAVSMFGGGSSSSSGGGLPCYAPVSVLGRSFSLCFTQYADKLSPIGGYLIFAAGLIAVFIVLRR